MMRTKQTVIYLVRHGETRWNVIGKHQGMSRVPLNQNGRKQICDLARKMCLFHFDVVYSSPALRTKQTAHILAPQHRIVFDSAFREFERPGFEGMTFPQVLNMIPDIRKQWAIQGIDWKPPTGGESLRQMQKRSITALKQLLKKNAGKTVLVTTHGSIIKAIVHWLHNGKPEEYLHARNPENAHVVKITCSEKNISAQILFEK